MENKHFKPPIVERVKTDLRISHDKLDDDIYHNIEACVLDLERVGINTDVGDDALMEKVIRLFVRWQYNFENQADRYKNAYMDLRDMMRLSEKYRLEERNEDFNV